MTARTAIVTGGASGIGAATLEHWQRTIAVNLTGTFVSMQAVLPDMVEAG